MATLNLTTSPPTSGVVATTTAAISSAVNSDMVGFCAARSNLYGWLQGRPVQRNYIRDPGFAEATLDAYWVPSSATYLALSRDTGQSPPSPATACMKMAWNGTAALLYYRKATPFNDIPVLQGTTYTYEFDYKVDAGTVMNMRCILQALASNGTTAVGYCPNAAQFQMFWNNADLQWDLRATDWTHFKFTFTYDHTRWSNSAALPVWGYPTLQFLPASTAYGPGTAAAGNMYIANVQFGPAGPESLVDGDLDQMFYEGTAHLSFSRTEQELAGAAPSLSESTAAAANAIAMDAEDAKSTSVSSAFEAERMFNFNRDPDGQGSGWYVSGGKKSSAVTHSHQTNAYLDTNYGTHYGNYGAIEVGLTSASVAYNVIAASPYALQYGGVTGDFPRAPLYNRNRFMVRSYTDWNYFTAANYEGYIGESETSSFVYAGIVDILPLIQAAYTAQQAYVDIDATYFPRGGDDWIETDYHFTHSKGSVLYIASCGAYCSSLHPDSVPDLVPGVTWLTANGYLDGKFGFQTENITPANNPSLGCIPLAGSAAKSTSLTDDAAAANAIGAAGAATSQSFAHLQAPDRLINYFTDPEGQAGTWQAAGGKKGALCTESDWATLLAAGYDDYSASSHWGGNDIRLMSTGGSVSFNEFPNLPDIYEYPPGMYRLKLQVVGHPDNTGTDLLTLGITFYYYHSATATWITGPTKSLNPSYFDRTSYLGMGAVMDVYIPPGVTQSFFQFTWTATGTHEVRFMLTSGWFSYLAAYGQFGSDPDYYSVDFAQGQLMNGHYNTADTNDTTKCLFAFGGETNGDGTGWPLDISIFCPQLDGDAASISKSTGAAANAIACAAAARSISKTTAAAANAIGCVSQTGNSISGGNAVCALGIGCQGSARNLSSTTADVVNAIGMAAAARSISFTDALGAITQAMAGSALSVSKTTALVGLYYQLVTQTARSRSFTDTEIQNLIGLLAAAKSISYAHADHWDYLGFNQLHAEGVCRSRSFTTAYLPWGHTMIPEWPERLLVATVREPEAHTMKLASPVSAKVSKGTQGAVPLRGDPGVIRKGDTGPARKSVETVRKHGS